MHVRRLSTPSLLAWAAVAASACGDAVAPAFDPAGGDVDLGRPETPAATPMPPTMTNPMAGVSLYVAPASKAKTTADAWRATRPADAAQLDKIAAQPHAAWFGNWNTDIRADVERAVSRATAAGAMPVLVAFNIPLRDCGSYAAGGAATPDAYRSWIRAYADGIAGRRAIVILEPDALGNMGCMTAADQATRLELLRYAIQTLRANPTTAVYLDAGNHLWHSTNVIATRLRNAGVELANGFSLNVSNFFRTADEAAYGDAISALVGGKHYIIDTSRNGLGATPDAQWCNPDGRALGERPTTVTGRPLADAYLWVKVPGESDGSCNGNPTSGTWMPEYALGLAQRASY